MTVGKQKFAVGEKITVGKPNSLNKTNMDFFQLVSRCWKELKNKTLLVPEHELKAFYQYFFSFRQKYFILWP